MCAGRRALPALLLFVWAGGASSCRQDMHDQPRYRPLRPSEFFDDGLSARPLLPGTVSRGELREGPLYTGKIDDPGPTPAMARAEQPGSTPVVQLGGPVPLSGGTDVEEFPDELGPIDERQVLRGQERFEIFCSPCHGRLGDGEGMVVRRGVQRPPSFHSARLRGERIGHYFDVVTNGFGAMMSYAEQVPVRDRWAIIAYIRALQLSQHASLDDVPQGERARLDSTPPTSPSAPPGTGQRRRTSVVVPLDVPPPPLWRQEP